MKQKALRRRVSWLFRDPWGGKNVEHFLPNWMRLSLYPDFIIGSRRDPYLKRWYLLPRAPWPIWPLGMYLHQIIRSDDERALHDHPWPNLSIVLWGGYIEMVPMRGLGFEPWMTPVVKHIAKLRRPGSVVFRRAISAHRLVIVGEPSWSLFIVGPRIRQWGFWCPKGWRHWQEFVSPKNRGTVGRGCE